MNEAETNTWSGDVDTSFSINYASEPCYVNLLHRKREKMEDCLLLLRHGLVQSIHYRLDRAFGYGVQRQEIAVAFLGCELEQAQWPEVWNILLVPSRMVVQSSIPAE